ncbi:hypothetical protein HYV50_01810 [Candidatus Pacearchaeota archaeon]|nr:hypothetical protein [Candidatus Pacearchaeota archaeon]
MKIRKITLYIIATVISLLILVSGIILLQKQSTVSAYYAGSACYIEGGEDSDFCSFFTLRSGGFGGGSVSHPEEGGSCSPGGKTYCYTDTGGGHQTTCQNNGKWGPYVDCSDFRQSCSCEGPGCHCKYI